MVQVSFPGVYVQEERSGVRSITGVSTSTAAFVGALALGKMFEPTRVLSFAEFERVFSSDTSQGELVHQVRQFFLNGGQHAYVVRIANGAQAATLTLRNSAGADALVLEAKSEGKVGNAYRVAIDYDTKSPESTFNLTVYREGVSPSGARLAAELERHGDLSMDPQHPRFVTQVLASQSRLLTASLPAAPVAADAQILSGRLFASAEAARDAINQAIVDAGGVGRIDVRIGAQPFRTVEFATNAGLTGFTSALLPVGVEVTHTAGQPLVLTAADPGVDLEVRRASLGDIAQALQLGSALGGLEIGPYAAARPVPTGWVSGGTGLTAASVTTLAGLTKANLRTVTVTTNGVPSAAANITYRGAGATLGEDAAGPLSLLHVRENLRAIARAASAATSAVRVEVHGLRLVALVNSLDPDAGLGIDLSTGPSDGFSAVTARVTAHRVGAAPNVVGDDGNPATVADYATAFERIRREVDLFNLLVLPKPESGDVRPLVWGAASAFCAEQRAFLLIDPQDHWDTREEVADGVDAIRQGLVKDHAALYWPRIVIHDGNARREVDPSGSIAGLMARIDANRGVWKAPAGTEADLRGVLGVQTPMSDRDNGVLSPLAINAIRVFPNGIVSWGARTLDGFDNSGNDDYKYVPVRRLALYLEESLVRGLRFAVFEPNDEPLWRQIRLAGGAFMNNLFRKGAFQGQKASDAYFVKCDAETTTQNDINLGIVNVVVGFAALKPAEFVVITLRQLAGQVQV